ncbi:TonB-dependent receptor plug domain-containing protein [Gammaproteobacteria bacterium]|nr:TonB-dependent receptor plug domain-containing protein [Gammaproteobacteria bacterium]
MSMSIYSGRRKKLALCLAAITTALTQSPFVLAQEDEIEEITVTGSRIRQTDGMAAPTPVTVVTPEELNTFDPGGTVSEQLDALPQFFGTQTAQRSVGSLASGVGSFLNMRSLGTQRTLVLLDGARMAPGDKRGAVNVDTFPTALVRTVDVVTGGASAAYGADALGGVTNFIIDREFQGLKISTGTGIMENGEGFRANGSIAGGFQIGDRLNIIASMEARQIDQIDIGPQDLDWYQRYGFVNNPDASGPRRLTKPNVIWTDRHVFGMISGTRTELDGLVFNQGGTQVQPFREGEFTTYGRGVEASTAGGPEADLGMIANSGFPVNGQEVKGRSMFVAANYQFTDNLSGYAQAVVGRSESIHNPDGRALGTSGISLRAIWAPRVAVDNAFLPDYVRQTMIDNGIDQFTLSRDGAIPGVRDIASDRFEPNVFNTRTYTVGFDYEFDNSWSLGGSYSTGETDRLSHSYNHDRVDRVFLAMDAVVHPDTGAVVCRVNLPQYSPTEDQLRAAGLATGLTNSRTAADPVPQTLESPIGLDNTVGGCVPFNILGHGNISEEAIAYTASLKKGVGVVEQDFAELLATGELHEGFGYGPISGAFGLTWRDSSFFDNALPIEVDSLGPPQNVPELGIRGIPPGYTGGSPNLHKFSTVPKVEGQYDVWEWFGEVNIPLFESDSGEQSAGGTLAFRQSDYSTSGSVDAWKAGIEFQVMEGLRFRATKSRDVREANFRERFDAQGGGGAINDPFQGDDRYTITTVASGNPNVNVEKADTTVFGFVYEPQFEILQGLRLSIDWYEVDIADAISQIAAQDVVDRCFDGDTEQCANIEFDPVTGDVTRVFRRFFNQDQALVEGLDFEVSYRMEPNFFDSEFESFSVRALAGTLLTRDNVAANGTVSTQLDQYTLPDTTGNVTFAYSVGPLSLQMQGRHITGGKLRRNWTEGVDVDYNWVSSSTWWNGTVRYSSELSNGTSWNLGFNILNMFDKAPPLVPGNDGGQGVSNQYDVFGRRYNLSLNMEF